MQKSSYEIEVLINGKPAKEYMHDGRVYVEGRQGTQFSLRLRNNTSSRKLFVPTIDGLSVLDGKDASFDSRGYIVGAYSTTTIDGWRTSDSEVAQFYFSTPKESYRRRSGKGKNIGIIGCAVFDENIRQAAPIYFHSSSTAGWFDMPTMKTTSSSLLRSCDSMSLCAAASSMPVSNDLGTGFGEAKRSEVISVEFDREPHGPSTVFEIYYNTREQLERLGVRLTREPAYTNAFPGEYCRPPKR